MQDRTSEEEMLHSKKRKRSELCDKVKRFRCTEKRANTKECSSAYWYAAMTEDVAQRSRRAFYEVVNSQ